MRVALLHNPSSGSEDHAHAELAALLRRAGHQVEHVVERVSELTAALQAAPCDLVVVAGGDGTVGRAACELSGWQVPLAIFPLGTANNTARSLKVPEQLRKFAKSWQTARPVPYDLGLLNDGSLRQRFAEAIGWGVFAEAIAQAKSDPKVAGVRRTLKRDRKRFRSVAAQAKPRSYRIDVEGRDLSGEYLLVEIMNVPLLGPRLDLSPQSDPGDGWFELVLVTEAQRGHLVELGDTGALPGGVTVERARNFRIEASEGVLHLDGHLLRHPLGARIFEVQVEPAAVAYLR